MALKVLCREYLHCQGWDLCILKFSIIIIGSITRITSFYMIYFINLLIQARISNNEIRIRQKSKRLKIAFFILIFPLNWFFLPHLVKLTLIYDFVFEQSVVIDTLTIYWLNFDVVYYGKDLIFQLISVRLLVNPLSLPLQLKRLHTLHIENRLDIFHVQCLQNLRHRLFILR